VVVATIYETHTMHDERRTPGSYADARRSLVAGSLGFWLSVAICLVVSHSATTEHDGISYFSVRATTLPIIVLGYASIITGMLLAARRLPEDELGRRLALPLRCMPVCLAALLVTPFNRGTALNWTHMTVGISLAIAQGAVALWLSLVLPTARVLSAAALQLVGGVVAALSMPSASFNFLLQGELLFNLGFCLCLLAAVRSAADAYGDRGDPSTLETTWAPD
jgi:hypothetical protein